MPMSTSLHQIAYASIRSPDLGDDQIVDDIALPAYRKNRGLEITGCLWFDDVYFLQFIEGPRQNLEDLYRIILADDRHYDVRELVNRPITERAFARFALQVVKDNKFDPVQRLIALTFNTPESETSAEHLVGQIVNMTDEALIRLTQA